jgi:hypothetical protein
MSGVFLARLTLSVLAGGRGVAPLATDLNRTHATNPLWFGHARFHVVWQQLTSLLVAIPEIALVWWPGAGMKWRFYVAATITATSLIAFFGAVLFRPLYGGTMNDPNGIPPLRVKTGAKTLELDGNTLVVTFGLVVLAAAVLLFRHGG